MKSNELEKGQLGWKENKDKIEQGSKHNWRNVFTPCSVGLSLCAVCAGKPLKLLYSQEERGLVSGPLDPKIAGGLVQRAPPLPVKRRNGSHRLPYMEWEPQASLHVCGQRDTKRGGDPRESVNGIQREPPRDRRKV